MGSIQYIGIQDLHIDHSYQRDLNRRKIRKMADNFEMSALGIITVSKRGDGSLAVVDGQHRVHALMEMGFVDKKVRCDVIEGLRIEEEAEMFRVLNTTNKPTPWDDYKAGIVAKDPECIHIAEILDECGYKMSNFSGGNHIMCVSTIRAIYAEENGAESLKKTLEDVRAAWGYTPGATERYIVRGISILHKTFGDKIDRASLRKRLSSEPGGASGIVGVSKTLKGLVSKSLSKVCALHILSIYNKRKKINLLDDREL